MTSDPSGAIAMRSIGRCVVWKTAIVDNSSEEDTGSLSRPTSGTVLNGYLTSVEFQHRVQAIVEGFTYLLTDVEREKRWFATKWARQEKEIRKIIDSTQGMYGDLQAVTGRSLMAISSLEVPLDISAGGELPS